MVSLLKYKINGGALYYAIIVILLLSLFSSGFILLNRLWFHENVLFLKNTELNDNLDSADEWLKIQTGLVVPGETKALDLFGDSSIVTIDAEKWGLLRIIKSSARWRSLVISRTALYSELNNERTALYLSDNNKFLSLVGKCVITGDCHLPSLGIRAGEMDGGTFIGKKMIDGKIYQSENALPNLSPELLQPWSGYWDKTFRTADSIVGIADLTRNPLSSVSFSSDTKVIDCGRNVFLQNVNLSGNIIVVASDTITITQSAHLQDVLVFANTIIVGNMVKGAFQLFARNKISIGDSCIMRYPSFVVCYAKQNIAKVTIGKNSIVSGGIIINSVSDNPGSNRLEMSDGNKLSGTVYVNGEVGFAGRIDGTLYSNKFFIDTPRAYYENFLKDAIIDSQSIPAKFGSFAINNLPDKLKLIKLCL
ncbi:MAG TPA: hypothetical protein VGK38_12285 [Prolixibacteraceae bacterium]|jgi:hypothetical protein